MDTPEMQPDSNWTLTKETEDLARLSLDCVDRSVNVLSAPVLEELEKLLNELEHSGLHGLIIESTKASGFIAGADVKEFTQLGGISEATQKLRYGQQLMDKIERLPFNTVAKIHGHCLGGGLELALACAWRVAEDADSCKLGLPEVMLGIHPGYGGTVRLPELIGDLEAMKMMLSGRSVSARKARKLGLVDGIAKAAYLDMLARQVLLNPPLRRSSRMHGLLRLSPARFVAQKIFHRQLARRVNQEHYPAPYQMLEYWYGASEKRALQLDEEANSVAKLALSPTARNLVRTFFLREALKAQGKQTRFDARRMHVIGAGVMGGDIAAWCALQGMTVTLQDREPQAMAPAMARAQSFYRKKLPRASQRCRVLDRLIPDVHGIGIAHADVVIEAVTEDAEIKKAIYANLQPQLKPHAILCTNTSSIPLETLTAELSRPEQFVGLHFFNPVAKMQLIEVVHHSKSDPQVVAQACAFALALKRLPLRVKSSPGFVINRILMPYLLEAIVMVDEGVRPAVVDKSATEFGMPMGPVELADTVGLDVCASVAEVLGAAFGRSPPESLQKHVEEGNLGRKTGKGYYTWAKGKPDMTRADARRQGNEEIGQRLVMAILKETLDCLSEGLVESADLLDAGMIFGTGFAPFHGGPVNYLKHYGLSRAQNMLARLHSRYGPRFEPRQDWEKVARLLDE